MANFWILLIGLFCLYIFGGLIVFFFGTLRHKPGGSGRLITRCADRRICVKGNPFTLRLFVRGPQQSGSRIPNENKIVLVIDRSGSMGGNTPGSRLSMAKEACLRLIYSVNLGPSRVAVVSYDEEATTSSTLTDNIETLKEAVESIAGGGSTDIGLGLERAIEVLDEDSEGANAHRSIVLLSDGFPANGRNFKPADCIELAGEIKQRGVRIICVGIGEANQELLSEMASGRKNPAGNEIKEYYTPLNREELLGLYQTLGKSLLEPTGTRALISDTIQHGPFMLGNCSSVYSPESVDLSSWKIDWFLPFVNAADQEIPYQVVPLRYGWHKINQGPANMSWHDMDYIRQPNQSSNDNPYVLVLPSFLYQLWFFLLNPLSWIILSRITRRRKKAMLAPPPPKPEIPPIRVELGDLHPIQEKSPISFRPTLAIGLGTSGRIVITYLKKILTDLNLGTFPEDRVRLLCIDTYRDIAGQEFDFAGTKLKNTEFLFLPDDISLIYDRATNTSSRYLKWFSGEYIEALTNEALFLSHSTNRLRQLGRLSYFKAMEEKPFEFWARMNEVADFIKKFPNEESRQIVYTGSVVGGTSNAIFVDISLWFASVVKAAGHLPTYTFLCGRTGFTTRDEDAVVFDVNTQAFLREWERFIINCDIGAFIPYCDDSQLEFSGGVYDHDFLVDPSTSDDQCQFLFPMVADCMSQFVVDPNDLSRHFEMEVNPITTNLALSSGKARLTNIGCRSSKLPVNNIHNFLRLKFVKCLFVDRFLSVTEKDGIFSPKEDVPPTELELRQLFQSRILTTPAPPVYAHIADLSGGWSEAQRAVVPWCKALVEVEQWNRTEPPDYFIRRCMLQAFYRMIEWAVFVLNGDAIENPIERRGGLVRLIGYLQELDSKLALIPSTLKRISLSSLPYEDRLYFEKWKVDTLLSLVEAYRTLALDFKRHVHHWFFCMVDGFPEDLRRSVPEDLIGLARQIKIDLEDEKRRLSQCLTLKTIHYACKDDFLDELFSLHFQTLLNDDKTLGRIEWRLNESRFGEIARTFMEAEPDKVKNPSMEQLLVLTIVSQKEDTFRVPIDNIAVKNGLLKLAEGLDEPSKYYKAFANSVEIQGTGGILSEEPITVAPANDLNRKVITFFTSSKGFGRIPDTGASYSFPQHYSLPLSQSLITAETQIPIEATRSFLQSAKAAELPTRTLPFVFLEEKNAEKLERYYRQQIENLPVSFSPRMVHCFGDMDRLQQFLALLLLNEITPVFPEGELDTCLAVRKNGSAYHLTRADDRLSLDRALGVFVIRRRDALDSSKEIPEFSYSKDQIHSNIDNFLHTSSVFFSGVNISETLKKELIALLKIIKRAGSLC